MMRTCHPPFTPPRPQQPRPYPKPRASLVSIPAARTGLWSFSELKQLELCEQERRRILRLCWVCYHSLHRLFSFFFLSRGKNTSKAAAAARPSMAAYKARGFNCYSCCTKQLEQKKGRKKPGCVLPFCAAKTAAAARPTKGAREKAWLDRKGHRYVEH